jgi:hypothetical protein
MRSVTLVGVMALTMVGCGYDRGNGVAYPTDALPATITLSMPSSDALVSAGDTRLVTAVVKSAAGAVLPEPSLSWRTSSPAVATVVGTGASAIVTAVDDGSATITASSGGVEGTVLVTVRRRVVSLELSVPDPVVVAGFTTQLTVTGRDARQQPINVLPATRFQSSNGFSVQVSPTGLATALYSSFRPFSALITATLIMDGTTLSDTKRIDVADAAPPAFGFFGITSPEEVRPEPPLSAGDGILYLTREGDRVQYKLLWSLLSGPPVSAHLHGPNVLGADSADLLVDLSIGNQTSENGTLTGSFSAADIRSQRGEPAISLDSLITLLATPTAAYVDVHTRRFPDGETRGPIVSRR